MNFIFQEFGERPGRKWLDHLLLSNTNSETPETVPPKSDSSKPNSQIVPPESELTERPRTDWIVSSESVFVVEHSFVDSFRKFHPDRESAFTCWMTR